MKTYLYVVTRARDFFGRSTVWPINWHARVVVRCTLQHAGAWACRVGGTGAAEATSAGGRALDGCPWVDAGHKRVPGQLVVNADMHYAEVRRWLQGSSRR